jgi:hypothetical protein
MILIAFRHGPFCAQLFSGSYLFDGVVHEIESAGAALSRLFEKFLYVGATRAEQTRISGPEPVTDLTTPVKTVINARTNSRACSALQSSTSRHANAFGLARADSCRIHP